MTHVLVLSGTEQGGVLPRTLDLEIFHNINTTRHVLLEYVNTDTLTLTRVANTQAFHTLTLVNIDVSLLTLTSVLNANQFRTQTLALVPFVADNAETTALLAASTGAYSTTAKRQIDRLITEFKSAGVWAKLDWYGNAYWALNEHDALLNWVNPAQTLVKVGSAFWTLGTGLSGVNPAITNARYKSGWDVGNGPHSTNTSFAMFCSITAIAVPQNAMMPMGDWLLSAPGPATPTGSDLVLSVLSNTGFAGAYCFNGQGNSGFAVGDGTGVWCTTLGSGVNKTYRNGVELDSDSIASVLASGELSPDGICVAGSTGSGSTTRSFPGTLMYWGWSSALSAAQVSALESAFVTAKLPPDVATAPTVTINQGGTQSDPTSVDPILFDVVFSESVTGFDGTGISFTGSTSSGMVASVSGSGTTYVVSVSGMNVSGTVVVSVNAGAATGAHGANLASTSTDNSVTFALGYTTFSPGISLAANVALSNGNLTGTSNNTVSKGATAIHGKTSGKWYFEAAGAIGSVNSGVGIRTVGSSYDSVTGIAAGTTDPYVAFMFKIGSIYVRSVNVANLSSIASGQVAGIAVDLDNFKIWFRVGAGNWNGSALANPATNTGGFDIVFTPGTGVYPVVELEGNTDTLTANFGDTAFANAAPSGFSGWTKVHSSSLYVDIESNATAQASGGTTVTVTTKTDGTNRIIVLFVHSEKNAGSPTVSTVTDTSGLTWTRRTQFVNGINLIEEWWALAPTAIATTTITVTFSATIDDVAAAVIAVAGANTSAPFDTNGSLPKTGNATSTQASVTGVSTTAAETLLLAFWGDGFVDSNPQPHADDRYTRFARRRNAGGTNWSIISFEGRYFNSAQSNITVQFGTHASVPWVMVADAIRKA